MDIKTETWKCYISDYKNGGDHPVTIIRTVEPVEATQGWRATTVFLGDLRSMDENDIMNSMAQRERGSRYGGQRFVSSPEIVSRNHVCTIMVQEGGLDI
jgi:hypothetical protein